MSGQKRYCAGQNAEQYFFPLYILNSNVNVVNFLCHNYGDDKAEVGFILQHWSGGDNISTSCTLGDVMD